jgi:hypothetical protein
MIAFPIFQGGRQGRRRPLRRLLKTKNKTQLARTLLHPKKFSSLAHPKRQISRQAFGNTYLIALFCGLPAHRPALSMCL